jgi:O-antigen/teichoic acid export membrane protein
VEPGTEPQRGDGAPDSRASADSRARAVEFAKQKSRTIVSIKRNILATYASQIYVTLIGIVMVPLYLRHMGAEAYGLVGFFTMLQAWFQLLDMGLTPTMARETARFQGGAIDAASLRRLLRALEGVFVGIALLGGVAMLAGAERIAVGWLNVQHLSIDEVRRSIQLIACIVALRWIGGLYRGAITGLERLVWLGYFSIVISTLRFVLVLPFLIYVGNKPTDFFAYQLALAVLELGVLVLETYRQMPPVAPGTRIVWEWAPLKTVLKFSLSIAFTSSVWVLVTQTDKLLLSKLLALSDYAHFTLAVLVAGGVSVVSGPIGAALLPRLTKLAAERNDAGVVQLYRNATQLVALIALPASLVLAFFAEEVLWVWTGDTEIARSSAAVLRLYALGNGVLALEAFPYYLQYAKGDMRLHLLGNAVFVVFLIPSLVYATATYGMTGAGWAWLASNLLYFVVWVPLVHRRFAPGLHLRWLREDIGAIFLATTAGAWGVQALVRWQHERVADGVIIAGVSLGLVLLAAASSSLVRAPLKVKLQKFSIRQG